MSEKQPELSWTPKEVGEVYCAPACGHGCTKAAYLKAEQDARALAQRLGPGWTPRVWENLGWHYEVRSVDGTMGVSPGFGGGYRALLGEPGYGGRWATHGKTHGKTPEEVITKVLKAAQEEIQHLQSLVDSFEKAVGLC